MTSRLLRSTATVGVNTVISRILGFVRDMVIARVFGASLNTDAFFVAFRLPNFLRRLFAEGAFSQAFVPVLSEYRSQQGEAAVRSLAAHVSGALGAALLLVTAAGVLAAPVLVAIFAPGFLADESKYSLTVQMVRITFPYLLFISLTAFAAGILNTYGRFGVPAFTPVMLNLALIGAALWLAPRMAEPVTALAWGVLVAGIAQLAFQLPFLKRLGLLVWPRLARGHEGVTRIARLMLPAAFGASVAQVNLLVDTLIASFLITGSVSWLYYSDRMVEFPLGVFAIALATVILPNLSRYHADGAREVFSATLDWALRWALLVATPSAVGLVVLAAPILTTLFQYGEFSARDVALSSLSLMAYGSGLIGFVVIKVLAPGYFARQDTRTPVRVGIIAMVVNVFLNLALVVPLKHVGLALATSLAAYVNAGLLLRGLRREGVLQGHRGWPALLVKVTVANVVMAAALVLARGAPEIWLTADALARALRLAALVAGGGVVYLLCLLAMGIRPRQLLPPVAAE
ncbi:MAG: murein biosynthesis integral membrane protein MurJ [Gammaproteobacteria bacterium]|nr:murein biosynthesis integral membrane protein MurJ [Gammaproteobacteria bacterium]